MVPATGGRLAKVRGRGECPRTGPSVTAAGHWVPSLGLPVPSSEGKIFWTHIMQQCTARSWPQEGDLEKFSGGTPDKRAPGGNAAASWAPYPGHLQRLKSVLAGGRDFRAPVTLPMQFPDAPSFIQQRQPQRSPCSEAESVASQKTALPALWNSPLGSAVGSHFSGAPGTIFFKRPPGGARQPARPGDGPGPLDTTTPGSHSNSVSRLSIRGWPGGPGTPSTELPGRPGLISASKGGLSHFLGGTPNDLAPRGTVVGLGTVTGLGAVTQPSPRASRAISVQSPPPKRA